MSENNQLLGYWVCDQGARAEVRQTKKQGRHFYTRCDCCGLNQGTGKKRQQLIYDNTEFIPGVTVTRPAGVEEKSLSVVADQPEKTEKTETELLTDSDFNPNEPEETERPQVAENGLKKAIVPGVIFLLAVGAGIWMQ
jgi:hypothetical protein